jgi:hypothetical protein
MPTRPVRSKDAAPLAASGPGRSGAGPDDPARLTAPDRGERSRRHRLAHLATGSLAAGSLAAGIRALGIVALAVGLGLVGAACGSAASGSPPDPTTSTSTPPTTDPPTTTVPPSTSTSTSTSTTTTTTLPAALPATPSVSASALLDAWVAGDRADAAKVATQVAMTTLFAAPYRGQPLIPRGCSGTEFVPKIPVTCSYGPDGGAAPTTPLYQLLLEPHDHGWYVRQVIVEKY